MRQEKGKERAEGVGWLKDGKWKGWVGVREEGEGEWDGERESGMRRGKGKLEKKWKGEWEEGARAGVEG